MTLRPFVVSVLLLASVACANTAFGQARVLIAPSTGAGIVFDDNLMSSPEGLAVPDLIVRVTPGLSASRENAHSYLFGSYSFDAERYQDHPLLTTPLARQTALGFARIETSAYTTWSLNGGYSSSVTPSEMNLTTGLFTGRTGGWRAHGGPELKRLLSPVTSVTAAYDVANEKYAGYQIVTHAADLTFAHEASARDEVRLAPFVREFMFSVGTVASAGATVGWTRRLTPFTSLQLQGGPRWVQGAPQLKPELDLLLRRRSGFGELSLGYTQTSTAVAGYTNVLETRHLLASAGYHHPATVDATLSGGVYFNQHEATSARVYRIGVDVSRRLTRALAVSASYSLDLQRGVLTTSRIAGVPGSTVTLLPDAPSPLFAIEQLSTDVPLRRNVLMLQLVVSPTIHPTSTPPKLDKAPDEPQAPRRKSNN